MIRYLNATHFFGLMINIAASILFIEPYGLVGVAYGTIIACIFITATSAGKVYVTLKGLA